MIFLHRRRRIASRGILEKEAAMFNQRTFLVIAYIGFLLSLALTSIADAEDAIETASNGTINWTVGEVYATGIGAPPAQAVNPAQARAMAERAAFVVAIRNLLETVKGVRVDSESVVENFMVKSDVIRTKMDGIVRGARIVKSQHMPDGSVEVLVSMPMKGAFMNALVPDSFGKQSAYVFPSPSPAPAKPSITKPAPPAVEPKVPPVGPGQKTEPVRTIPLPPSGPVAEPPRPSPGTQPDSTLSLKGGMATGLVIDGRGLGLKPALLPKIVDQQGREIYVGQVATRTNAVEQGVAGYAKDVNAASNNFRVTDNPAIVKGLKASGPARTDIMIGQGDADALRQFSSKSDFLQYCRVIIVY
jgi:hypothetical protein